MITFHSLHWPNLHQIITESQKMVFKELNIPLIQYKEKILHGLWMNRVIENSGEDVIGFFDADCIPINPKIVIDSVNYVKENKTFIGLAQATNNKGDPMHIFAAPSFFIIHKDCYEDMGRPSFLETARSDVAQEVTYKAQSMGIKFKLIYPTHYEGIPVSSGGRPWRLADYGVFGIGTLFGESIYHLYQGRENKNALLFQKRAHEVINNTFNTKEMSPAKK